MGLFGPSQKEIWTEFAGFSNLWCNQGCRETKETIYAFRSNFK
ncbi:hypothetical protein [Tissierella sp. Yu-01]|nr:hypothetical protein [Tissierella sp. Yu-01]WFA10041.1 hypothetical protein P3962_05665 [Tissierella sp. Yu-01]